MARRGVPDLSAEEQGFILGAKAALSGHIYNSDQGIANAIHTAFGRTRSRATVSKFAKRYIETRQLRAERGKRPRCTTQREDRAIVRAAEDDCCATSLDLSMRLRRQKTARGSPRTFSRRLVEAGLHRRVQRTKPELSQVNQVHRLAWAQEHVDWTVEDWKSVGFTDESSYLAHWSGKQWVWRRKNEQLDPKFLRRSKKHPLRINVMGGFCHKGKTKLIRVEGRMDSTMCRSLVRYKLLPCFEDLYNGRKFILQHDNATNFKKGVMRPYLQQLERRKKLIVLDWPSQSPDLNPIENLWKQVDDLGKDRAPATRDELFDAISSAWDSIPKHQLRTLIRSMPARCREVIVRKGEMTHY